MAAQLETITDLAAAPIHWCLHGLHVRTLTRAFTWRGWRAEIFRCATCRRLERVELGRVVRTPDGGTRLAGLPIFSRFFWPWGPI